MTIAHPTLRAVEQPAPQAIRSRSELGVPLLFFDPGTDGQARDTKRSFQTAQAAAFLIGAQNSFLFFWQVALRLGIVPTAALTGFAPIALFAIGGAPVTHELVAATMTTFQSDGDHLSMILIPLYLSTTQ
jgi:hypothetical protein